jgi:hypothetical protein
MLIDAGVDVNHCRGHYHSDTPLQCAVSNRHTEIVHLLLEAGADANAWDKDHSDGPPLAIASERIYRGYQFFDSLWCAFVCATMKHSCWHNLGSQRAESRLQGTYFKLICDKLR